MKTILLCSGELFSEREYARMIELELLKRGYSVTKSAEDEDFSAEVIIFDELLPEDAERLGGTANEANIPVICCARELINPLPTGMLFFERPFDIEQFLEFVDTITSKGKSEAQKLKGFAGDILIDRANKIVTCRGERIFLTSKEYELLLYLDDNRGNPVSREEALRNVWGFGYTGDTNVVDVYIRYLRRKLDERFDSKFIVTVRNKGYMLR